MPMPIIKDIRDIKKLQIPDFNKDGLGPMFLEHYRYIKDKVVDKYPIDNGQALGPLEMASYLRGITELLKDFYFNPDWIHELLDITAEVCIAWIKTQDETLGGLKKVFISEDTVGFIRPEFYKEFVFPYDRKVFKALPDRCIGIYHCGSNSTHILEMIPNTGAKVFYFGSDVNIAHIKEKIGRKICLMGNIHPLKLLLKGTPKDVEEECKRLIKIAGPGGGYILGTGEGINEGTPLNNIDAMIISSKKYGKYPIK
jgi:uroporphyrinogen decarboxylase